LAKEERRRGYRGEREKGGMGGVRLSLNEKGRKEGRLVGWELEGEGRERVRFSFAPSWTSTRRGERTGPLTPG